MRRSIGMMRLRVAQVLLLIALSISFASHAAKMVPLKGSFYGEGATFEGNFTHLGRFDGVVTGMGTATWIAANGDSIDNETVSFSIGAPAGVAPNGLPLFTYTQGIAIDGGTGRFTGATGVATVEGTTTLDFSYYDGYLNGTITRPNSRK